MITDEDSYNACGGTSEIQFEPLLRHPVTRSPTISKGDFIQAAMINGSNVHLEADQKQQSMLVHHLAQDKVDYSSCGNDDDLNNYNVTSGSSDIRIDGNHLLQTVAPTIYLPSLSGSTAEENVAPPAVAIAGKKRKSETGLANVSMKTVMRWRGKEGIDIDCLLGASATSTVEERTKAEEILNATGQLLCILCAQSVSGNKKSVRRHQLKNAKHLIRSSDVANGLPFPTTDAAMNIVVPLPYVPLDMAVSTVFRGYQEAWEIVKNAEKATDFAGLTANLESLGKTPKHQLYPNISNFKLFQNVTNVNLAQLIVD